MPLSPMHRLARRHNARTLRAACCARTAAELISHTDGSVPPEMVELQVQTYRAWLLDALGLARTPIPRQTHTSANDDDEC